MAKVSLIIPGRCEPYFQQTINSACERAAGDYEIIAIIDGPGQDPITAPNDRVKIIELSESIGQRAGYNFGVRESSGDIVGKIDAHALMSEAWDIEIAKNMPDKTVILPEMRNLDVELWKEKTGKGKRTHFMYPGLDLYCHFWSDYKRRPAAKYAFPEVMTGQGSCWFTTREWNDYIGLLDEGVGSWGNVGIEVSLRTWLCGGQQLLNKNVWQAHWFRRDEGGFTYPMNGRNVKKAHDYTWNNYYFKDDAFEHQVRPFYWYIDRFAPVPSWEAYLTDRFRSPRYIVYYTDSQIEDRLANAVRKNIKKWAGPIPIISVSQAPLDFGENICIGEQPRKYKSIYEAVLRGVSAAPEGAVIYLLEHDVFYHPSHFAFLPADRDSMYFNRERYYYILGKDSFYPARGRRALSQCVAYREAIIRHAEERLSSIAGDDITERWDDLEKRSSVKYENFRSDRPNVDIRHGNNFTGHGTYKKDYAKDRKKGVVNLPGWGRPKHFQSKTGYKELIGDPAEYLHNKYNKESAQVSPVRIPRFTRADLASLFNNLGYKRGAEIGVREGAFSKVLCSKNIGLELRCIDPWAEYHEYNQQKVTQAKADAQYRKAAEILEQYNATLIRKTSMDAVKDIPLESLDFIYIDANHTFDFVMQDVIEWAKRVRPGGMVAGHDYFRFRNAGVVPAVDAYTHAHQITEWFITDEKEASFFWVKR